MKSTRDHIQLSLIFFLILNIYAVDHPVSGAIPLTGQWQFNTASGIHQNQYYPPFHGDFSAARFPLVRLNSALDTTQFYILLVQDMTDKIALRPPPGADSLYASGGIFAMHVNTPFLESDTLILTRTDDYTPTGLPVMRLITEAEWNQLAGCHPVGYRTLNRVPIFNRTAHVTYNLDQHHFETFRRWPQMQSSDPLAAASFFKSLNYTVQADGEQFALPLDAVLTDVNYIPGTGILKIEYLLNDDNLLTLSAVVSAAYPDPIFCVLAEMTYREGQTVSIKAKWELDRPDIAFMDSDLPPQEGLQQHFTVFAHSAESIKIARRYTEIISQDVAAFFQRETEWWQNWHRLDKMPTGLTAQQSDQWLQALTFLEITPSPMDLEKSFDHALTRAWGLCLGGHADEANDDLGLILDQIRESMSVVEWARFLTLAQQVSDRLGHVTLIKSNWDEILKGFAEPVIAQFRSGFPDHTVTDKIYLLAGLNAMATLAKDVGVPASAYVYQRLSQQIQTALEQTFVVSNPEINPDLLSTLLWAPGLSQQRPHIYTRLALNNRPLWQLPVLSETTFPAEAPILPYMNSLILARQSGYQREAVQAAGYPLLIRAAINAHLFPKTWDCQGNFHDPDLSPHIWTSCLLLFADD
ncbi:MAG: hypothetical protein K9N11_08575 [Lentisphaeria bacterium]|nr:hypothetical protein [Candidatus Neomarinimicrobiota bacterium]MCF7842890.1 hypothetical protein [Lentisphaeria bacterium]